MSGRSRLGTQTCRDLKCRFQNGEEVEVSLRYWLQTTLPYLCLHQDENCATKF
jgi:hypothetical protein